LNRGNVGETIWVPDTGGSSFDDPRLGLAPSEARRLTEEVKRDAQALWSKLVQLYEGGAHTALGYPSWAAYCEGEFGFGKSRAYQLLQAGRTLAEIEARSTMGDSEGHSTMVDSAPRNERQLREVAKAEDPAGAWRQAQSEHGRQPTGAQVKQTIEGRATRRSAPARPVPPDVTTIKADALEQAAAHLAQLAIRYERDVDTRPPELRSAWEWLVAYNAEVYGRMFEKRYPIEEESR
jgi:hypothetical protein